MNASGSQLALVAEQLPLDELELGSLRGILASGALDVDLGDRSGRGSLHLLQPRYSGLSGTGLQGTAR